MKAEFKEFEKDVAAKVAASFVFWDGLGLAARYSGVGVYAFELWQALRKLDVTPAIISSEAPFFAQEAAQIIRLRSPRKLMTSKLIWPNISYQRALQVTKAGAGKGLFHGLSNINVPWMKRDPRLKTLVTVHDLTPLLAPALVSSAYALQFSFAMKRIIPKVDAIIAVSDWTAETLREFFPAVSSRIHVIKNGRPEFFQGKSKPYIYREKSVLTVSRFEPYKNLPMIGEIAERGGDELTFHIVTDSRGAAFFQRHYARLIASKRIVIHQNAPTSLVQDLYTQADCYFQPSLYEGFCLPVMEAVSHGLPIAYLKGSAVDEIALPQFASGSDRNDPDAFLSAIHDATAKSKTADFFETAKSQFLNFATWDDAARKLKSLYTELL